MYLPALQSFPQFNIYSTPLLILVIQGLILCFLLYRRYLKKSLLPDLLLTGILLILCYHRTTYTIGFMAWYDTFRNTKINYYLVSMGLVMAPLIYFYIKSVVTPKFRIQRKHLVHFVPWLLFFAVKTGILIYDSRQPGFDEVQNGDLVVNFQWTYLNPLVTALSSGQMLLYLAFSFQLYHRYKQEVQQFFSNTPKKELPWIRNFLLVYSFIFIYGLTQIFIDEFVFEMSWIQKWWIQLFSAMALLYFGVMGYFSDFDFLKDFKKPEEAAEVGPQKAGHPEFDKRITKKKASINRLFEKEKIYLNLELNLAQLSERMALNRTEVSEIINIGFGMNFNDFVNRFRIAEYKERLRHGDHQQFSLVGLAFECGFNSKATFNRVFKKEVQLTPTQYLQSLKNKGLK